MTEATASNKSYPPCYVGCPVHTDNQRLVELIINGKYEEALELLLDANPFTSVCGRICHHPCEQNCRRVKIEAAVGLRKLKRFIVESTKEYRISRRKNRKPTIDEEKRVAIVGSGPAGMTAAHDLAKKGVKVVVFEKSESPGGLLGNTIPRYRLPFEAVMEDIEDILSLGVELKTGSVIGEDYTINDLFNQGFKAVILATGLSESRTLNIPGIDSEGVMLALPFLQTVRSPKPPHVGKRTVVIGGGNVALDVARSAKRLGAESVKIVCLESREEMPAWIWEVEEAAEEGISIMNSWGPQKIYSEEGSIKGIELRKCVRVFDENGRFSPQFDESDTAIIPADNVIIAIGQRGNLSCLKGSEVETTPDGRIVGDRETLSSSQKGVFLCGELLQGPASAVESVRDGHRAAEAVLHYIDSGELIKLPLVEPYALSEVPDDVVDKIKRLEPIKVDLPDPEKRIRDFRELERPFTEKEALAEARRCLACTTGAFADEEKCAACLNCVRICPFGVATIENTAIMPQEKCQACGLCAAQCPAAAIALKRFGTNQMKGELEDILKKIRSGNIPRPFIVSYCCLFEVTSRDFIREKIEDYKETGIFRVMVPCVARLSVPDILSPFEFGADGVVIISCSEGECLYPTAEERLLTRIRQAKDILREIGVESEIIDFWKTQGSAEVSWNSFWEISRRKLNSLNINV